MSEISQIRPVKEPKNVIFDLHIKATDEQQLIIELNAIGREINQGITASAGGGPKIYSKWEVNHVDET